MPSEHLLVYSNELKLARLKACQARLKQDVSQPPLSRARQMLRLQREIARLSPSGQPGYRPEVKRRGP